MSRSRTALLALPLALIALASCSDDGYGKSSTSPSTTATTTESTTATTTATTTAGGDATPTTVATASGGVAIALADNTLGKILVDGEGRTLYLFMKDTPTVPACVGDCLSNWPPLTDATAPTIGDGLAAADFGTIALADGSQQITFHGHQLYYFAADSSPGDVNGQGIGGSWFVVDSAGNAIQ